MCHHGKLSCQCPPAHRQVRESFRHEPWLVSELRRLWEFCEVKSKCVERPHIRSSAALCARVWAIDHARLRGGSCAHHTAGVIRKVREGLRYAGRAQRRASRHRGSCDAAATRLGRGSCDAALRCEKAKFKEAVLRVQAFLEGAKPSEIDVRHQAVGQHPTHSGAGAGPSSMMARTCCAALLHFVLFGCRQ